MDPCIIVQFIQKDPTRCNSVSKFIILYLYVAQPVGPVVAGRCRTLPDSVQQPQVQQPSTYAKPEGASAVLDF